MPLNSNKLVGRTENESKGYATSIVDNQNYNIGLKNPKWKNSFYPFLLLLM
jgi:hypothetical protein